MPNTPDKPFKIVQSLTITKNDKPYCDAVITWHEGTPETVALIEGTAINGLAALNKVAVERSAKP
jgi:hypothetical protein